MVGNQCFDRKQSPKEKKPGEGVAKRSPSRSKILEVLMGFIRFKTE
jgi:hypothetical protein